MYAVVDSGGKQYRVEPGRTLVVDRLDAEAGATVTFDRVLLIADDDEVTVGTPTVAGASVRGTVLAHGRGPKIIVFRFRPKAHYRRRTGHRSALTQVRIDEIATASGRKPATTSAEKPARSETKAAAKPASRSRSKAAAQAKADGPAKAKAPSKTTTAAPRRRAPAKPAKED
jgi:large subunit ribosomal protein L21